MTNLKVVLDTNIYLSGIIFGGNARHILDLVIEKRIIAVTSPAILFEISDKLEKKFDWEKDQIITAIKIISKTGLIANPKMRLNIVKADKSDNKIIEAAVKSGADIIISSDRHLLQIKKYQNIKIISPSQFLPHFFQK